MEIDEFCPCPDRAITDKTRQAKQQEPTFQISKQSEFVCSSYRRWRNNGDMLQFESINMQWFEPIKVQQFDSINMLWFESFYNSNPSKENPSNRSNEEAQTPPPAHLRIHKGSVLESRWLREFRIDSQHLSNDRFERRADSIGLKELLFESTSLRIHQATQLKPGGK